MCWVASTREVDAAVAMARALVRPNPCNLVLSLDSPNRVSRRRTNPPGRVEPLTPEMIGKASSMLRYLYGSETHVMVLPGNPLTELRRYVRTHDVSLVVMGSQARAVEREYGERLIDDPPCPGVVCVDPRRRTEEEGSEKDFAGRQHRIKPRQTAAKRKGRS